MNLHINLESWTGPIAYVAVFLAAAMEGELVYVSASVLVSLGRLDPAGVFAAGALGGSLGDQFFFYALRGRLRHWIDRFPRLSSKRDQISKRVQEHATAMILSCRFLPGLRIAIPAACAYAGVPAWRFSTFSLISGMAWAGAIMLVVAYVGPASLTRFGVNAWWTPILPALLIVFFFRWIARGSRTTGSN